MTTRTLTNPLKMLGAVGLALLLWGVLLAYTSSPAWASETEIQVNSLEDTAADDGQCTLREAITSANTNKPSGTNPGECVAGGTDDVIRTRRVEGIVNLTGRLPKLSDMFIDAWGVKVRRDTGGTYRIFTVADGAHVGISGMTIANGVAPLDNNVLQSSVGGGVSNEGGTLNIWYCNIINNSASWGGGGIYNRGKLMIRYSTISGNEALYGGGIYDEGNDLTINQSTVSNNHASIDGGGMWTSPRLKMKVINSTFSGNTARNESGRGEANGGAILFKGNKDGYMTVTSSTFTANRADRGGAFYNDSNREGDVLVRNSILAKNRGPNCGARKKIPFIDGFPNPDVLYGFDDGQYNLVDDISCWGGGGYVPEEYIGLDPEGLQYNGGRTDTVALLPTSFAINRIPEGENGCGVAPLDEDQRGVDRPQGNRCDIGSFERRVVQ